MLEVSFLLLIVVAVVLYVPSFRLHVLHKGIVIANNQTDYDIELEQLYLSPFHQHPVLLYHAYKGKTDLPVKVEIDHLFVGHRGQDTLVYVHSLRLRANILTSHLSQQSGLTSLPIVVDTLRLESTTFHSDSLIASVGVDAVVSELALYSPQIVIAKGEYPLHGLRITDANVGIDLRPTAPDTTAKDTTPLLLAFDIPDGVLRNIHYRMTPLNMDIRTNQLVTDVLVDVGANLYDARQLDVSHLTFSLGQLYIPADTIYGNAHVDIANNIITTEGLHVRSDEIGATVDLLTSGLNLGNMRVDVNGQANYQGSQARLRGFYDIDDEAYDMQVNVQRVNLAPLLKSKTRIVLAGDIKAAGKGLDPNSPKMKSKVHMHLKDAIYDHINVSGLVLDAELANKTVDGTLHLPVMMKEEALQVQAQTEHQFSVSDFMKPEQMIVDYHTQMRQVRAYVAGEHLSADSLFVDFATDSTTSLALNTKGLSLAASSPMHVL